MSGRSYEPLSQAEDAYHDIPEISGVVPLAAVQQITTTKPRVYYNDGPFSAPSSVDESQENLLEKVNDRVSAAERGDLDFHEDQDLPLQTDISSKRPSPLRCLVICLLSLFGLAIVIGIFAALSYSGKNYRTRGSKHITMDHIFNGTFGVERKYINWVPEAGDGVFSINEDGTIKLVDLKTNSTTDLLKSSDVRDENGRILPWTDWELSPDMEYVLVKSDHKKQWRWSSFGNYYIHKLKDHTTHPVASPTHPPVISYATWSPTGESIAFVSENDLYVLPSADTSASAIRVTYEGNSSLFFGVPDWVYEEEVFSSPSALWWSPDSRRIAFLRSDETQVNDYTFPIYNPTEDSFTVTPYTDFTTMKYPKPGYKNPLVSVHVFDLHSYQTQTTAPASDTIAFTQELTWNGRRDLDDSIIQEIAWVANSTLLVKEVSRAANDGSVVVCDLAQQRDGPIASGSVVRQLGKDGEQGDEGWIDAAQNVYPLPGSLGLSEGAYLDVLPTKDGYNQIALFSPAGSSTPQWLTSGLSEVAGGILSVDAQRRLVYFLSVGEKGIERKLFSVPIPTGGTDHQLIDPTSLTSGDLQLPAYYSATFSPQSGFYLLSYEGPNIPWQRIIKVDSPNYDNLLTNNSRLNQTSSQYQLPISTHLTIDSDGYELNALEIRPPNMDDSGRTKYPVLFRVYGGPGSQTVDTKFQRDWHHYVACSLKYIVVTIDGRGTGFKGRQLRNPVKGDLGYWETQDQINAAKFWASKKYVDVKRIGIWGWARNFVITMSTLFDVNLQSYGGFMAAKVVEADAGIHSLSMSVAPVISWRLYDTIYTERYMGLPDKNPSGYVNASISNVTAFNNVDYLLAHGSGDDNVHFANTAHLLDMFTREQIRGFRFRMFTDSDHSINKRGANRELYEWLTAFLIEKWGHGGKRRG